jgi:hypothetical protein
LANLIICDGSNYIWGELFAALGKKWLTDIVSKYQEIGPIADEFEELNSSLSEVRLGDDMIRLSSIRQEIPRPESSSSNAPPAYDDVVSPPITEKSLSTVVVPKNGFFQQPFRSDRDYGEVFLRWDKCNFVNNFCNVSSSLAVEQNVFSTLAGFIVQDPNDLRRGYLGRNDIFTLAKSADPSHGLLSPMSADFMVHCFDAYEAAYGRCEISRKQNATSYNAPNNSVVLIPFENMGAHPNVPYYRLCLKVRDEDDYTIISLAGVEYAFLSRVVVSFNNVLHINQVYPFPSRTEWNTWVLWLEDNIKRKAYAPVHGFSSWVSFRDVTINRDVVFIAW